MKKTVLTLLVVLTSLVSQVSAQYFIRDYNFFTAGFVQDYPVDINYHASANLFLSLHHTPNGKMNITQYNGSNYSTGSYISIYKGANTFEPIKMVHFGNYTTVLFQLTGTVPLCYGLVKYDHTTNVIAWAKSYVDATNGFDINASSLVTDNTGANVYVVGQVYNTTSNMGETYLSQVNSSTGALNWHKTYSHGTYNVDLQHNIYFHSNNAIYIAANSYTTPLNRSALLIRVNSIGALLNNMLITYNSPCTSMRLTAPSIKRLNNDVYVFCPSIVGADGSGEYFLAKLTPTLSAIVNYKVFYPGSFYFYQFYAPEFEFVNNNTHIMVSGIRSLLSSSVDGYVHAVYDLNFNLTSIRTYQNQNVGMYATPIYDAYNPTTNLVFSVAQDAAATNQYYGISSDAFGNLFGTCETTYVQSLEPCTISGIAITITSNVMAGPESNIRLMKLDYIEASVSETCTGCPGCPPAGMAQNENNFKTASSKQVENEDFKLYPNPVENVLNAQYTLVENAQGKIQVTDLVGRVLKTIVLNEGSIQVQIDLSNFSNGSYLVNLYEADKLTATEKIIVTK